MSLRQIKSRSVTSSSQRQGVGSGGPSAIVTTGSEKSKYPSIVVLIWVYFWLLIIEGALRKWVFPSLSAPLLIVRDPVVILIYLAAIFEGVFPLNRFMVVIAGLAGVSFLVSLAVFDNVGVILYGLRTNFLHLPLIFVMQKVMTWEDVKRLGRWILLLAIPMTILVAVQFASPKLSWINAAAGGELGGQMVSIGQRIRPSGLFSFVTGMVSYLTLGAALLLGGFIDRDMPKWLRLFGIPCLTISLAISGSRSAMANVVIVVVAVLVICLRRISRIRLVLLPAALTFVGFFVLAQHPLFREGMEVNEARLRTGGGVEQGIIARYFGDLAESMYTAANVPVLGYGLGVGTNVGSALLTGSRSFLLGEGEWSRVVGESGPIVGYTYIFLRLTICVYLIIEGWKALGKGHGTPILLVSASLVDMVSGQFGQSSMLGFAVFTAGLALASTNRSENADTVTGVSKVWEPARSRELKVLPRPVPRRIRGRSPIAEAIINSAPDPSCVDIAKQGTGESDSRKPAE